jgi:hypothetical protein
MRQRLSVLVASPANLALMPMMAIGSLADDPRSGWSPFPDSRFRSEGVYHPNNERLNSVRPHPALLQQPLLPSINMRQRLSVLVASPANLALMPMMAIGSPWYLSHGTKAYPFNLVVDI